MQQPAGLLSRRRFQLRHQWDGFAFPAFQLFTYAILLRQPMPFSPALTIDEECSENQSKRSSFRGDGQMRRFWLALVAIVLGLGLLPVPVRADSLGDQLIQDAKGCSLSGVQQDLAHGANVNATHPNGRTALMLTAEWCDDADVASALIAHGANVNAKDNDGVTALMQAASVDSAEIARVLLAHGADVNAKAKDGSTALGWTEKNPMGRGEVADMLVSAGAQ